MKELNVIQTRLHAPKDKTNAFGGYKYRSLESILEDLKPLLKETGCTITFSDTIQQVGDRYYIATTCTLKNAAGETETSTAWAREQEQKKGMDEAQVTGSASSYARKYAVCSLLAIDDNQEPDMMDNREEGQKPARKAKAAPAPQPAASAPARTFIGRTDTQKIGQLVEWLKRQPAKGTAINAMLAKYEFEAGVLDTITAAAC